MPPVLSGVGPVPSADSVVCAIARDPPRGTPWSPPAFNGAAGRPDCDRDPMGAARRPRPVHRRCRGAAPTRSCAAARWSSAATATRPSEVSSAPPPTRLAPSASVRALPLRTAARRMPGRGVPARRPGGTTRRCPPRSWRRCAEFDAVVEVLGWDEAFLAVDTEDPEALAPASSRPGCGPRPGSTARWASGRTSCRPSWPPGSASRQGCSGSPAPPGSTCSATCRPTRCGASARRPPASWPSWGSTPCGELAGTPTRRSWRRGSGRRTGRGCCGSLRAGDSATVVGTPYVPAAAAAR